MRTMQEWLALATTNPLQAADELDEAARQLKDLAARIRENVANSGVSLAGMGDRVQIRLVGPGGETKHYGDTQGINHEQLA